MNKTLLCCASVILCISLMIMPCFGANSYGTVVSYSSVKFPGASNISSSGQYILVNASDFLPYVLLIYQYNREFERYFTNSIYDLPLIRFNNSTSQDYIVPVMRIGPAQPKSDAPSTIQINGRLISWDGTNDPTFNALDFPFNNSKTISDVSFGNRTASFLLACDNNSRVIACSNNNGEYEMIETIKNTISIISSDLTAILDDNDLVENHLTTLVNAILNKQGDNNLTDISSKLTTISSTLSTIRTKVTFISDTLVDVSDSIVTIIDDYISIYFPKFDSDLDSINTQLQYFYQSFQYYMASIDSHLENIDENVQAMHDEMSGEALKDFTVQTSDGQSPSLWQVIKNSLGWMMSPFGKFFSMIMDSTRLFNNAGNGWSILYDVTSASETYDPERISP